MIDPSKDGFTKDGEPVTPDEADRRTKAHTDAGRFVVGISQADGTVQLWTREPEA